jgi:hypothetical protein
LFAGARGRQRCCGLLAGMQSPQELRKLVAMRINPAYEGQALEIAT